MSFDRSSPARARPPAAPEPFAAALARLIGRPLAPGEPVAIAVSGGPDSMAALLLARAALGPAVRAFTVDHGLRPGSADEAATIARACRSLGVVHATLVWTGAKPVANLQAAARAARYRLLALACAEAGVGWLVTAHHIDDQAETVLMRVARGAGPAGLAAIRPHRALAPGVTLLRPLLGWRRADLAAVCAAAGVAALRDPANADPAFARTRARALLAATPALAPARLAALAAHAREADAALAWVARLAWDGRARVDPGLVELDAEGLPRALLIRLARRALGHLAPAARPRGPELARLVDALAAGDRATLAGVAATGGAHWRFVPEVSRIASAGTVPHVVDK